jgi:hypothetical protein
MKFLVALATVACFSASFAYADDTCVSKAIDKNGKPLAGAAKTSFMDKCKKDAKSACEAKAMDKNGKPLAGAAKTANVNKCVGDAVGT